VSARAFYTSFLPARANQKYFSDPFCPQGPRAREKSAFLIFLGFRPTMSENQEDPVLL
jgi:hypothetical protein